MENGLLELLRSDLDPRLEDAVILVALAPALDVDGLQESNVLKQFQRTNAAVLPQRRFRGLRYALLKIAVRRRAIHAVLRNRIARAFWQARECDLAETYFEQKGSLHSLLLCDTK
jgi:hypothetical protein